MDSMRIDKWLWAARFFKTRNLARQAVDGGKVHLNGYRVKPSKPLAVGDELRILRGEEAFEITVDQLSLRRGSASVAATLFTESEQSILNREQRREQARLQRQANVAPARRPDKKQRRALRQFKSEL